MSVFRRFCIVISQNDKIRVLNPTFKNLKNIRFITDSVRFWQYTCLLTIKTLILLLQIRFFNRKKNVFETLYGIITPEMEL